MEITPEIQKEWNAIIVDILKAFIKICKQNGLRYYCAGGTAIGAVRHSGMIPWDDDIDVFMPRPDYDKFFEICGRMDMECYETVTPHHNDKYPLYFSKLVSKSTTLQEEADIPFVTGLYIDIFPLDGASDDMSEALKLKKKFIKLAHRLTAISTRNTFSEYISLLFDRNEWGRFLIKLWGFVDRKGCRRHLLKSMDAICSTYNYDESSNVITYSGVYGKREIYPKSWIEKPSQFQFEGLTVDLPGEYDTYLRNFFGDYMKLPPVEQRTTIHSRTYFNLNKRENETVVLKRTRKGNK